MDTVKCEVLRPIRVAGKGCAPKLTDRDKNPVYADIPVRDVDYLVGAGRIKAPEAVDATG